MPIGTRQELGRQGEEMAAEFLCNKGYRLLVRNWRHRLGEIDILMADGETIVLVEVKTQTGAELIDPVYKLNLAKQRKLALLARLISGDYPDRNIRVDAVTLYWKQSEPIIQHYSNIITF